MASYVKCILQSNKTLCDRLNVGVLLKFIGWNPDPPSDGMRRWGLWEELRSWGWSPCNGISALIGDPRELRRSFCPTRTQWEVSCPWTRKRALTRRRVCRRLDLGLSSLQSCEKQLSVAYKPPSLWDSDIQRHSANQF